MSLDCAATIKLFARRIRETRQAAKMSIDYVSFRSGYSRSYIQRLERGDKSNPTICVIWAMATVLNVTPEYLLGIDEPQALAA